MTDDNKTLTDLLDFLADVYENKLPFNKLLGLKIDRIEADEVCTVFDMRPELIGNFVHGVLHGGVISSTLDATGGMVATAGVITKLQGRPAEEISQAIAKVGTIDLRVDYLRPGLGERFYATGSIMRSGKKVTVARIELHNEKERLIAVGTGTYIVG